MRGNVAGSAQTFYAAVLDDGNIVRPVPVSRYAYHPVRSSREKWGGAEEKKKWGGAEEKKQWGAQEKKKKWEPGGRVLGEAAGGQGMGGAGLKKKWGGAEEKSSN
jgi:hypothetical protein